MPTRKDMKDATPAILRGTVLGSILGILPGGGAVIASFAAYTLEKKIAKDPSRFGKVAWHSAGKVKALDHVRGGLPPATSIDWPLIQPLSSDRRLAITRPTSSGSP